MVENLWKKRKASNNSFGRNERRISPCDIDLCFKIAFRYLFLMDFCCKAKVSFGGKALLYRLDVSSVSIEGTRRWKASFENSPHWSTDIPMKVSLSVNDSWLSPSLSIHDLCTFSTEFDFESSIRMVSRSVRSKRFPWRCHSRRAMRMKYFRVIRTDRSATVSCLIRKPAL